MKGKTLKAIVLGLGLAIGLGGCNSIETQQERKEETIQIQPQDQTRRISGKIINIDEDSFAMFGRIASSGANCEFEHIRIKTSDGEIYKLLFPGPSNYQVGDNVNFQYKEQSKISFNELIKNYCGYDAYCQKGYFDKIDGIVIR